VNTIGFMLFIVFLLQLLSGILLSTYYIDYCTIAFDSIIYITININIGWFIRILHVISASLFMLFLLLHFLRALYFKLFMVFYLFFSFILFFSGFLLFILSNIEGFLGYILVWGQMSYWGITVMINIIAVLPYCGIVLSQLIWNNSWVILNRIFIYHFLIGILISLFIILHIIFLHNFSSSNPLINNNSIIISFYPIIFKDIWISFMIISLMITIYLYIEPDSLGNSDNQIKSNSLVTPINILPEWYYLIYYSCLRSFSNKIVGVIIVLILILILI